MVRGLGQSVDSGSKEVSGLGIRSECCLHIDPGSKGVSGSGIRSECCLSIDSGCKGVSGSGIKSESKSVGQGFIQGVCKGVGHKVGPGLTLGSLREWVIKGVGH